MWLKSLKISLLFVFLLLFSCNKKEKYPEMKTGYYNVVDERLYPNGNTDTLYYSMLGPRVLYKDKSLFMFIEHLNGSIFNKKFWLSKKHADYLINSELVAFTITDFSISSTELIVYLISDDTLGYSNKITLSYIE
ncbi:MAG: hypothetical protein RI883_1931 [Bacteroidota bacterium]|jgi:hypothetical protein